MSSFFRLKFLENVILFQISGFELLLSDNTRKEKIQYNSVDQV